MPLEHSYLRRMPSTSGLSELEGEPAPVSHRLEQTAADLSYLKGATLTGVKKRKPEDEYDIEALVLTFKLKTPIVDAESNQEVSTVDLQVWEDPEGNGPGYLALTGMRK